MWRKRKKDNNKREIKIRRGQKRGKEREEQDKNKRDKRESIFWFALNELSSTSVLCDSRCKNYTEAD